MEDKIQGIVLQSVRYGDTSLIVKVYTRNAGLQSYMIKGACSPTSKNRPALFQNLNMIGFVASRKPNDKTLGHLRDVELSYVYQSIPFVINKMAISMYVSELLIKTLTGQEQNENLFDFLCKSLTWLDLVDANYANFPLFFSLELCRFLGFYPNADYVADNYFDLMEGRFDGKVPVHSYYLDKESSALLSGFLGCGVEKAMALQLGLGQRRDLLDGIILFMRLHAPVLRDMQSHEVLRDVLG